MKKSYFVIGGLIAAFAAIMLSVFLLKGRYAKSEPGTVATVNGVAITEQQVNELILHTEISNAIYEVWIPLAAESPETKEASFTLPTDFTTITKRLVRSEVTRQYLAKQGSLISYDDVCQEVDLSFSSLLDDETFKSAFENAIKTFHTTKGQYIDLCYDNSYMVYSSAKAESLFEKSGQYDKASDQSLEDQFKKFVDSLEEQASIVYNSDKINAAVS